MTGQAARPGHCVRSQPVKPWLGGISIGDNGGALSGTVPMRPPALSSAVAKRRDGNFRQARQLHGCLFFDGYPVVLRTQWRNALDSGEFERRHRPEPACLAVPPAAVKQTSPQQPRRPCKRPSPRRVLHQYQIGGAHDLWEEKSFMRSALWTVIFVKALPGSRRQSTTGRQSRLPPRF